MRCQLLYPHFIEKYALTERQKKIKLCNFFFIFFYFLQRVTISGHRNPVYCVAFDKTNRRLFTVNSFNIVQAHSINFY